MKKPILIFALLLFASTLIAQTIHRVNTNPAVTGLNVYQTLQDAHDAAAPGDIVIIEASSISSGNLVSTKSLKIYGKGYFTGPNPDLHVSPDPSLATDISFEPGSDNSEISGVTMNSLDINGASNIRVYRNRVILDVYVRAENTAGTDIAVSNIQLAQNYFERYLYINSTTQGISTITVTNNHVEYISNSASNISGLIITYNNIDTYVTLNNAVFQNNIFYGTSTSSGFTNCTVTNNVLRANHTAFPGAGVSNIINSADITSATTGFIVPVGTALPNGISEDERWQLAAGATTLKTYGTDGGEIGMYGGLNPYKVSGIPGAPSIIKLVTPDYGNTAADLPVTISIKSNN